MTNFDEIKTLIAPDLSRLESIIKQSLKSNSPLLEQIVDSYLQTKGKQIRPIIVILSAKFLAGKVSEDVLHGAAAVELLHNASLIHDDVIDETKKRRGRDTINSNRYNHIAVLVGDFFVSNALACAAKTNDFRVVRILSELGKELSTGELDQIDIANRHTIDEKTYYEIIRKKTASLFRSCVQIAGYAVGANEHDIDNLARFIELLGLCFQIKDDTFDYFRDDTIGKPTGNDLREGKVTLPLLFALRQGGREADELRRIILAKDFTDEHIERLIAFAKAQGGIEYAEKKMEEFQQKAVGLLAQLPDTLAKQSLKILSEYIISRKS